jgi:hypothetical protein
MALKIQSWNVIEWDGWICMDRKGTVINNGEGAESPKNTGLEAVE